MEAKTKHNRVKVHSLLSVVSSKPCEPGKFHKLSVLDHAMDPYLLHLVLYYKSDPFSDGLSSSQLDNLRISLSETLNLYPVVTGRLTRGSPEGVDGGTNYYWQVKLSDAGVRMLHADVGVTLDEWLRSADAEEERDLTVWEEMPEDPSFWSPYRIQISNFKCGGLAIGISCNHMQADITSIAQLIKSWSEVHRGRTPRSPIFQLPITSIMPPNNDSIKSPFFIPESSYTIPPSKMDTVTMKFSGSAIEKSLSQICKQCADATPFDVLTALFWSRISQYQEPSNNKDCEHKSSLSICFDARNKGKPVIPNSYYGNALHFSMVSLDKSVLNSGLGQVSNHIHRHATEFKSEDFWSVMNRLEDRNKEGNRSFNVYDRVLVCISTEHLADGESGEGLMSGAVFGNGEKPVYTSFNVRNVRGQQGLIVIMPSSESGSARNVTVSMSEEVIEKMCKDQMILDMEPVVIMSGGKKRCE